ncbi:Uncharacterised protein [Metamycoplasma arthritidis]|uniref:Uncharacterized protein n=1 Tax=Metamycoplasma arthritidis (strain 158L3-1) TaxID=243272 RepID=B3PMZ1_META1|nr:hypothetical protein [Metamycoplasma arthritidis]ACF07393.1 hypothetical protein MARTH_orf600 [Metamycoplasma arthritidis 158L3-1]VEU78914.1 Uncharacterised protein [Metamycoplasma arthritidis]
MMIIRTNPECENPNFKGIVTIATSDSDAFLRELYLWEINNNDNAAFSIEHKDIYLKDCFIFSQLTKSYELFNLSAKNFLTKRIYDDELWDDSKVINFSVLEKICENINENIEEDFLRIESDFNKMLKTFFKVNETSLLTRDLFFKWLENYDEVGQKVVILKNLPWVKIEDLVQYLDKFVFIILTDNFFDNCIRFEALETCAFWEKGRLVLVHSLNVIINWIEKKINKNIDLQEEIKNIFNSTFDGEKLFFNLKSEVFS